MPYYTLIAATPMYRINKMETGAYEIRRWNEQGSPITLIGTTAEDFETALIGCATPEDFNRECVRLDPHATRQDRRNHGLCHHCARDIETPGEWACRQCAGSDNPNT